MKDPDKMDFQRVLTDATKLHQTGQLVEAARLYASILEQDSRCPDALHQMGLVCHQWGKPEDARQLIERAIQVGEASRIPEYRVNLAAVLNSQANYGKALQELDLAKATAGWSPLLNWYLQRAQAHRALGQTEAALATLREGRARYAQDLTLGHSFALTLHEAGRLEEAVGAYQAVLQQAPHHSAALLNLTQLYHDLRRPLDSDWIERLQLASRDSKQILPHMRLEFAIAKSLDLQADYEQAWKHYQAANAVQAQILQQRGQAFDADSFSNWVDRLVDFYQPSVVRAPSDARQLSTKPVFIVGMPRTGSTLLEQMLLRHDQVGTVGESNRLSALLGPEIEAAPTRLWSQPAERLAEAAQAYLRWLDEQCPSAERVINKLPWNIFHLGLIRILFPNARVIYCERDRWSTLVSCFTQAFTDPRTASICCDRKHLVSFWDAQDRLGRHWKATLGSDFLQAVDYCDLVKAPETQLRKLMDHLQLAWSDKVLSETVVRAAVRTASVNQVQEPVHTRSLDKWRRFEPWLSDWDTSSR